jgi:hypothetical protein
MIRAGHSINSDLRTLTLDDRLGSNSVLGTALADVRITPESGCRADIDGRLKCAKSGCEQSQQK